MSEPTERDWLEGLCPEERERLRDEPECPFCEAGKRRAPLYFYESDVDRAFTLEPLNPVTEGHLLVIPFQHVADATTNPTVTAETMRVAAKVAATRGAPCNLITSVGHAATQTVMHLHIHVVPRHEGDGLRLPWTP
jgi:histidine triad (HIT) family protein